MLLTQVEASLSALAGSLADRPELGDAVLARFRAGRHAGAAGGELPEDVSAAADVVRDALPSLTHSEDDIAAIGALFAGPSGELLLSWCAMIVARHLKLLQPSAEKSPDSSWSSTEKPLS